MVPSGGITPQQSDAAELRARAETVRGYARDIPDKEAAQKLREFAAELDKRAEALEWPITPGAPDL